MPALRPDRAAPNSTSWRWVDYWSPVREVIYFKRNVYARALEELGRQAFPDGPPPRPTGGPSGAEPGARPPPVAPARVANARNGGVTMGRPAGSPGRPGRWARWLWPLAAVLAAGLLSAYAYNRGQASAGLDAAQVALERRALISGRSASRSRTPG